MHISSLPINHLSLLIHQHQILRPHPAETLAVRVYPEMIWHDRIPDRDMAAGALVVVALVAQPAERSGVMEFAEGALGLEIGELRDADVADGGALGAVLRGRVGAVAEGEGGLVDCLGYLGGLGVLDCCVGPCGCGVGAGEG